MTRRSQQNPSQIGDSTKFEIDQVCDQFECLWRREERPQLEELLTTVEATGRKLLFRRLLKIELQHRYRLGEHPDAAEYKGQFPDYGNVIDAVFSELMRPQSNVGRNPSVRMSDAKKLQLTDAEITAMFSDPIWAEKFPPILKIEEASELLRTPVETLREWRSRGYLDGCCEKPGKHVLFIRDRLIQRVFNDWHTNT